jgi:hypothetical protein
VLTILVRFGTASYPRAEEQIEEIFRRQMPEIQRSLVVVDNALPPDFTEPGETRVVIGGDNTGREFSAFDRAMEYVGATIRQYDLVHFATEAFNSLYTDYLARFDASLLNAVAKRSVCVGHIDCYNEPIEILGFHSQHWIRTCFFFLPPTEVRLLGRLTTVHERELFFSRTPGAPFRPDAPISAKYREYITDWLSGRDIGQGVAWHSSFPLSEETLSLFEAKAVAIMNEQLFGVRLRAMGCHLIDVTWLATMLRRTDASSIQWRTAWQERLANRDRDALRVTAASAVL